MPLMRSQQFEDAQRQLTYMSVEQLDKMLTTAMLLRRKLTKDTDINYNPLFDAIVENLQERGLGKTIPPYKQLKVNPNFIHFESVCPGILQAYMDAIPNISKLETKLLTSLIIDALICYLEYKCDQPENTDFWGLILNAKRIPGAMEAMFPGYMKAGILELAVRSNKVN